MDNGDIEVLDAQRLFQYKIDGIGLTHVYILPSMAIRAFMIHSTCPNHLPYPLQPFQSQH